MAENPPAVRVFILDDHDQVRQALAARLRGMPDLELVGEASGVEAGLHLVEALRPDVVLVESKRTDGRGLEVVNGILHQGSGAHVIVLTTYLSEWEEWAVRRAGADRYLLKDIDSPALIDHIRTTATG
jgi:DNA-binding NarL/FixJ family response regulator